MMARAKRRSEELGVLKNSITNGEGNYAGFLGEEAVKQYLNAEYSKDYDVYNHDLLVNNFKIEVKTKRRTVHPKLSYEVSIAKTSDFQIPDYYVFTSVDGEYIWIIGYISYDEYFKISRFIPKGTFDVTNRFTCNRDMYNLENSKLYPIREMKNVLSTTNS